MNPNEFDPNTPAPLDPELQAQAEAQGELSVPLGVGEFEEPGFDPLAGTESKRRINASVLIIVGVMVVAAGGLFAMKKVARVAAAGIFANNSSEVERIIEEFLPTLRARASGGTDTSSVMDSSILTVLNETYTEHQVPLRDVQKNPFIMYAPPTDSVEDPIDVGPDPEAERLKRWQAEKDELEMAFQAAGRTFRLKSVMGGTRPMAILNDKIVRVGETIQSENEDLVFRVTAISASSVEMIGEAPEYELEVTVTVFLQNR